MADWSRSPKDTEEPRTKEGHHPRGVAILARIEVIKREAGTWIKLTEAQERHILKHGTELKEYDENKELPWFDKDFLTFLQLGPDYRFTPNKITLSEILMKIRQNAVSSYYATIKRFRSKVEEVRREHHKLQGTTPASKGQQKFMEEKGFGFDLLRSTWPGWQKKDLKEWEEEIERMHAKLTMPGVTLEKLEFSEHGQQFGIEGGEIALMEKMREYIDAVTSIYVGDSWVDGQGNSRRGSWPIQVLMTHVEQQDAKIPRGLEYEIQNLSKRHWEIFRIIREHPLNFLFEKADKGAAGVLYSEAFRLYQTDLHMNPKG